MKTILKLLIALLLPAALCLPASTQENDAAPTEGAAAPAPETTAVKKAAPKKKAAKKAIRKAKKIVSEYKFTSAEKTPTYKFDKKANPIMKAPAKKKKGKGPDGKKTDADSSRYIEEESATRPLEEGQ